MGANSQTRMTYFQDSSIVGITLPERFTFPFYYRPHRLTEIAAAELQQYLETQTNLDHNFGLGTYNDGLVIGKMFGVLVVQDRQGQLGYLSAFSGKLAGSNDHPMFVPPVFDMLIENSFFLREQEIIQSINDRIEEIISSESYLRLKHDAEKLTAGSLSEISAFKQRLKANKAVRKQLRETKRSSLTEREYLTLEEDLIRQSLHDKHQLNVFISNWMQPLNDIQTKLAQYESDVEALKNERKERSAALQKQLFDQYLFLNQYGETKNIQQIFKSTALGRPPAGAGECATPKLLQFAFANGYKPVAMAEFWWGASPKSEIRKHKQFYPACTGKCKPILAHMLEGMLIDDNPFLHVNPEDSGLEIVYEDEYLAVVNKPSGLRSVPGVDVSDSVYSRLRHIWINEEPLVVHRLDMDTSGLLVIAKTREAHRYIQRQFLQHTISKRYRALISEVIDQEEGEIDLPLASDMLNRPRQLVCFKTGKKSVTKWKVVERNKFTTKVDFWPLTGRTHQLRMHSAHELGLNAPIVGDDLYGTPSERMCLHAAQLQFIHPATKERMNFEVKESF